MANRITCLLCEYVGVVLRLHLLERIADHADRVSGGHADERCGEQRDRDTLVQCNALACGGDHLGRGRLTGGEWRGERIAAWKGRRDRQR